MTNANAIAIRESRTVRRERLGAAAVGAAAAVAVLFGFPAHSSAASVKAPKLESGVLHIKGTHASEEILLRLKSGDPGTLELIDGSTTFEAPRADVAEIDLDAGPGDDLVRIDESNGIFTTTIPTTVDGGPGDDTLLGGSGAETFRGGPGDDTVDGNRGTDVAFMGSGKDTFIWDPGDGSDTIEGQSGRDTMLFNGANAAETVDVSANGHRLLFLREPAGIRMDTDGVERVEFNALGGADLVTVHDLRDTDVDDVSIDLGAADNAVDRIVVEGSDRKDRLSVDGDSQAVTVRGLAANVELLHPEAAKDQLAIAKLAGDDTLDASGLAAGVIALTVVP